MESQAILLLRALYSIYVALAAFAAATLVTLLGAVLAHYQSTAWFSSLTVIGLSMGAVGVSGLIFGCFCLFRATQLSVVNIREEANLVRMRRMRLERGR